MVSTTLFCRRIHITEAVYEEVRNDYVIEDGEGFKRDAYLKDHNIESYFIVTDQISKESVELNQTVSSCIYLIMEPRNIVARYFSYCFLFFLFFLVGENKIKLLEEGGTCGEVQPCNYQQSSNF